MKGLRQPAFTLIEMLIVSMIIATLAVTMAVRFNGTRDNAQFDSQIEEILTFFQKARGLAQSNLVVDGSEEGTSYYYIQIDRGSTDNIYTFKAVGEAGTELDIEELEVDSDYSIFFDGYDSINILYTPPYGDVCFNVSTETRLTPGECEDLEFSTVEFTLMSNDGEYSQSFEVSRHGGFIQEL